MAAQHRDDLRRRAGDRAVTHRSRAESWARAAGVAGTGLDPRRVAYTLPSGLGDPAGAAAAVAGLETSLAAHYAGLVASAPAGGRAALVDAVAETTAEAVAWGAALPALPGMPEQDAG
ncbi:DUF4439 domain-containing protein [Cellulomonas sp. ATA003]|uniref:DUF4439 domain-containing protein n=1 Tax=Cellulomonas sp. ATA003 TaxID=3073064 RepID=UPI002873E7B7|nr:DUF4439 domain-containing protein [Cellulomonas sp. ATA003]WNB84909.1 DUF4439 domain-containing protein [Cellulomonas sp. ATA003]